MVQFYYFNDYISIVKLQSIVFHIILCCSALNYNNMLMNKLVCNFEPCWHDYCVAISQKFIKIVIYKSIEFTVHFEY